MKIKKLTINKMPGFPHGMPPFQPFAANVNILAGVNGSGKSSTAKVLQKLIWWDKDTTGYNVDALIDVQNATNHVEVEAKSYIRTQAGQKTGDDFSFVSPREFSNQYMLALHDLVRDDDTSLAAHIAREVNGGVDPGKAADRLLYHPVKPTLGNIEYRQYRDAVEEYKRFEAEQHELKIREDSLSQLNEEKKQAEEAVILKELYQKTDKYLTAKAEFELAKARFDQFPLTMFLLRDDDYATIENLEKKLVDIDRTLAQAAGEIQKNRQKIAGIHTSQAEISPEAMAEATLLANNMALYEERINHLEKDAAKQAVMCRKSAEIIAPHQNPEALKPLNVEQINNLSEFTRTANEARAYHRILITEKPNNIPHIVVIAIVAVACAVVAYLLGYHEAAIALLPALLIIPAALILSRTKRYNAETDRAARQLHDINKEYARIRAGIGILPPEIETITQSYNAFYVFVEQLGHWQEASIELEKLNEEIRIANMQLEEALNRFNQLTARAEVPPVQNAMQATIRLNTIKAEQDKTIDIAARIETLATTIAHKEIEKQELLKDIERIYTRTGLQPGDKTGLYALTNAYADWKTAHTAFTGAETLMNAAHIQLTEHPLYPEKAGEILILTREALQTRITAVQDAADRFATIIRRIAEIETRIAGQRKRSDLEMALHRREESLEKLHEDFTRNLHSMTGDLIISQLHQEISLNNDNPVFKKANGILSAITRGRYSLTISDGRQPTFCALDNLNNHTLTLKEISTGTRVQLLLAIRLAYIESQENAIRLPIIADELLANSDDQRSEAIIQALIEISRTRQVFYLTAQADEVAKWKHYLSGSSDIEYDIVYLGDSLPEMHANIIEMTPVELIRPAIVPQGQTHREYGQTIGVPPYNIGTQEPGELHLWYLIDNVDVLYNCLGRGIERWGQLNSYLQNGGRIEGLTAADVFTIRQLVQLLQRVGELYNYGHPRPVDRDVLIRSGAITDAYLDKTAELLAIGNYKPDTLLAALDAGVVKGFRVNKKEELRQYLLDNGYISANRPYDEEEIRLKLAAFVSNLEIDSAAAQQFLNRLLNTET